MDAAEKGKATSETEATTKTLKTSSPSDAASPSTTGDEERGPVVVDDFDDDDSDEDEEDPESGKASSLRSWIRFKCAPLGGMFVLCECNTGKSKDAEYPQSAGAPKEEGKLRWVVGPYWNMLLMTYAVIITITVLVFATVISSQDTVIVALGLLLSAVTLTFLSLTAFSDPGIFPRYTRPMARDWSYSNQAGSFRPPKVIYCRECKLLIDQYDHFCPWSGTVIGAKNIHYFHFFVSALVCTMLYDAIVIIVALTTDEDSGSSGSGSGVDSLDYGYTESSLQDWFPNIDSDYDADIDMR